MNQVIEAIALLVDGMGMLSENMERILKDKKEVDGKKSRWRAEYGKGYYYSDSCGSIVSDIDFLCGLDTDRWAMGNYFKTKEEGESARRAIFKLLKEGHENGTFV